jgi:hypothetical protein
MAVNYLQADCRPLVGDICMWSGRYVPTFQKNLLPPPRRCLMINGSSVYSQVEAAGSREPSIRLPDDTASHPKTITFIVTAVKTSKRTSFASENELTQTIWFRTACSPTKIQSGYLRFNEGWLDWSQLAQEQPSKTHYWWKDIRDWKTRNRSKQLLDDSNGEVTLHQKRSTGSRFGKGYEPVARQITGW